MITFFTTAKPFIGEFATAQRNAIRSWTMADPEGEVILFGDEEGAAELAGEIGARHVPLVKRSEFGVPLLNDLFDQARRLASNQLLAYVNADIILMSDLIDAVRFTASWRSRFLLTGKRTNLVLQEPLKFEVDWEQQLRAAVENQGSFHVGVDYFVFPKNLFGEIPPFAIGREYWSSWLLYEARNRKAAVVDASQLVLAVHQEHSYSPNRTKHPEWIRNRGLIGGARNCFLSTEATHLLSPQGIKQRCRSCYPICVCQFEPV